MPLNRLRLSGRIAAVMALVGAAPLAVLSTRPAVRPPAPETWQFDMVQTWRRDRPGAKEHTRLARLWIKGDKMRREEKNMITIVADGWIYNLEKDKQTGVKRPASKQSWQAMNIPSPLEFALQTQRRGKQVGTDRLHGQRMTIYQATPELQVWVGADGLVHKTAGRWSGGGVYAWEMRNFRRGTSLPDSLFHPPANYQVGQVVIPSLEAMNPSAR